MIFLVLLLSLFTQTAMSHFLREPNPAPNQWHVMSNWGMGGEVTVDIAVDPAVQDPSLVMKLSNEKGDVLYSLNADKEGLKIGTLLSNNKVSDSKNTLTGGTGNFELTLQAQGERLYVSLAGSTILLPYSGKYWDMESDKSAWRKVGTIRRIYLGGQGVTFSNLSAIVLT